jgi:AcrR family transcriptional regulator
MTQTRRQGVEGSKKRDIFIDAAETILRSEGYIGISSQNVADKAGLTKQLLYYYFRTMDDLILALVRRVNERRLVRFEDALASSEPLKMLWSLNNDPASATLATELTAIAGHRDAIRTEIIHSAQRFRALQVRAVSELLIKRGKASHSAAGIVMIATAIARTINSEASLGLTEGHAEALAIVEQMLGQLSI